MLNPCRIGVCAGMHTLDVLPFDALNSIDPVYRPYAVRATVVGSPSREVNYAFNNYLLPR